MPEAPPVQITLRPLGTPVGLGLVAILVGSAMLAFLELGWVRGAAEERVVAFVGLGAAFPLELLAAILAILARDALAATGFGIFSTIWLVSGVTLLTSPPGSTNDALGAFLILGALVLALLLAASGRTRKLIGLVIVAGFARLLVTGLYEIFASDGLATAAGVLGLVLSAVCAYGVVALLQEDIPRAARLPTGRSGRAASALEGGLPEQLADLEHEAGVRRQL